MTTYLPRNNIYSRNTYATNNYMPSSHRLKGYTGSSASSVTRKPSPTASATYIYNRDNGKKYLKGKYLGKGGFAKCYLVTEVSTGKVYAAKVIDKRSLKKAKTKEKLGTEIKIHKSLDHKYICKYESFFEDSSNVYILLELCKCRSMMDLHKDHKSFTVAETKYLLYQLLKGIQYMHDSLVIHRDLKLGNLFLDADENGALQVKIGDFGLATQLQVDSERKTTICGTPNYIAPEILMNARNGHSFEVDIWSFGVILYTCLNPTGKPPFETRDVKTTYRRIKNISYRMFSNADPMAVNLITSIFSKDPEHRPNVKEILAHPFFAGAENIQCPSGLTSWATRCTGKSYPKTYSTPAMTAPSKPLNILTEKSDNARYALRVPSAESKPRAFLKEYKTKNDSPAFDAKPSAPATKKDDEVKEMHANLTRSFAGITVAPPTGTVDDNVHTLAPKIWVQEYADFSAKYGLAYRFNTGIVGAFFNDCTKMLWNPVTGEVEYIPRRSSSAPATEPTREMYTIDVYPETLKKKIVLIDYFKSHFDKKMKFQKENIPPLSGQTYTHVKMWVKTPHSYVFRMSNRTVQVAFEDKSEILLSSEAKIVTYLNRAGDRRTLSLAQAMRSYKEPGLSKRLKYTKDVLYSLIHKKK